MAKWLKADRSWYAINEDGMAFAVPSVICSSCGELIAFVHHDAYCPACGAKKDDEEEESENAE